MVILEIIDKIRVNKTIRTLYAEDGAKYYIDREGDSERLYVTRLWSKRYLEFDESIHIIAIHGNEVYFSSAEQVYTTSFTSEGFVYKLVRDRLQDEEWMQNGVCQRIRNGKVYVYKVWEDPESDAVLVDIPSSCLKGLILKGIHRGRAIYLAKTYRATPIVRFVGEHVLIVEATGFLNSSHWKPMYFNDNYPFIYITLNHECIHVLDTRTITFLPDLRLSADVYRIVSVNRVHNGEITAHVTLGNDRYMISAQLPDGYYLDSANDHAECDDDYLRRKFYGISWDR